MMENINESVEHIFPYLDSLHTINYKLIDNQLYKKQ